MMWAATHNPRTFVFATTALTTVSNGLYALFSSLFQRRMLDIHRYIRCADSAVAIDCVRPRTNPSTASVTPAGSRPPCTMAA
jgi:hypothetical protein